MTSLHKRVLVFLDLDDVLAIGPYSGWDALQALRNPRSWQARSDDLWQRLFSHEARTNLATLHCEFSATYVISSTWREHMSRSELATVLQRGGLDFVVSNLHRRWRTPSRARDGMRSRPIEIEVWLQQHHRGEHVLIIDDRESGAGLERNRPQGSYVVLCAVGEGFVAERLRLARDLLCAETPGNGAHEPERKRRSSVP